jgi:hypothetical protein
MTAPDLFVQPALKATLAAFDQQVRWCEAAAPFQATVLRASSQWLAQQPQVLAEVWAAAGAPADPLAAALPLRWASGLHHLALLGQMPWAGLWPPAQGAGAGVGTPDTAALTHAITQAWHEQPALMRRALAGPPQTNEVQRSAALLLGVLALVTQVAQSPTRWPLYLFEVGSSAGLNLWLDRWQYRFDTESGTPRSWGEPAAPLLLRTAWRGPDSALTALLAQPLAVVHRAGCDAAPVDLRQASERVRLASYVWPDQHERLARLHTAGAAAAGWMQAEAVAVQAIRAARFAAEQLAPRREGQMTVLMHSVVWQYLGAAEQAALQAQIEAAGARADARAPLAWLRMEPPIPEAATELRLTRWPGGQEQVLARVQSHVGRVEWLA